MAATQFLATALTSRGLARSLTTPEGREALMTVTSTNPGKEKIGRAAAWLAAGDDGAPARATPESPDFMAARYGAELDRLAR